MGELGTMIKFCHQACFSELINICGGYCYPSFRFYCCLLYTSQGIEKKVLNQPATTMIFPGHGPYTTVKNELLTNPFIS